MPVQLHFAIPSLGEWWINFYSTIDPVQKEKVAMDSVSSESYHYTVLELWERFNSCGAIDPTLWKKLGDIIQCNIKIYEKHSPVEVLTGMEIPEFSEGLYTLRAMRVSQQSHYEGWKELEVLFQNTKIDERIALLTALVHHV